MQVFANNLKGFFRFQVLIKLHNSIANAVRFRVGLIGNIIEFVYSLIINSSTGGIFPLQRVSVKLTPLLGWGRELSAFIFLLITDERDIMSLQFRLSQ